MSAVRFAVVGGGITGLAAAHRLSEVVRDGNAPSSIALLEASSRLGGHVRTERIGDYILEAGPDTLVAQKPAAVELAGRIGLADDVVAIGGGPGTEVVHRGRLVRVPAGFLLMAPGRIGPVLRSPLFSLRGKLRMAGERFIPPRRGEIDDESLASFVRRRFGAEVLDRVAEPIVGGLYTARAEELSLRLTLPQFLDMERRQGSVTRAMGGAKRPAGGPAFHALRGGLGRFVEELGSRLPAGCTRLATEVQSLRYDRVVGRWRIQCDGARALEADAVILASPAHASARMLRAADPELSATLGGLEYASCATVTLAYPRRALGSPLRSLGFFVPRSAGLPILACSYVSEKFEDRGPRDQVVLRTFLGGAASPEVLEHEDERLVDLTHETLARLLQIEARPALARVHRFPQSMPLYKVGQARWIDDVRARIERHPGLFVAGSTLGAKGLPDCIRSGEEAARSAVDFAAALPERLRAAM